VVRGRTDRAIRLSAASLHPPGVPVIHCLCKLVVLTQCNLPVKKELVVIPLEKALNLSIWNTANQREFDIHRA
jgi:hypothetical protein